MTKTFHLACAYIIICVVAAFTSCTSHPVDAVLDEADALFADYPDSAYALLKGIDAASLPSGSERQARYALLYTKCQYKTYDDAPTDSLISLAADYYEEHGSEEEKFYAYLYQGFHRYVLRDYEKASVSFMRAMANSESVDDPYSKGQMYGNLSLVNLVYHCTDALLYAWKAFDEFQRGGLEEYAINAKVLAANSHLQVQQYDSCRILLDQAIDEAQSQSYEYVLQEAISLKAHYAVCVDTLPLAEELIQWLVNRDTYQLAISDVGGLATIYAKKGEYQEAQNCLISIRNNSVNFNDSIQYYCSSYWVNKATGNNKLASAYQDSVLLLAESLLNERLHHTSLASQKDYSDWRYTIAEIRSYQKMIVIIVLLSVLLSFGIISVAIYRKRQIEIKYLQQTIQKLQLEKAQYSLDYEMGLQSLMHDDFVVQIRNVSIRNRGLSVSEIEHLYFLFNQKLPRFEASLRELINVSDIEWHICMLLKLSFPPGDIAFLLNKTPGAISSARLRMYQRVFHRKGHTIEWDEFIKSI